VARLLAGLVFSLGLIPVIVGEAELFTGDVAEDDGLELRSPAFRQSQRRTAAL
jgi:hypothetical protein